MQKNTNKRIIIAPSILSADCAKLGEEVEAVIKAGADWIHLDVMDNHYVPNLTFGPLVCQALLKHVKNTPIDVHIMASPVDDLIIAFAKAGASYITFHPEASLHVDRSLELIKSLGKKAGLALNPSTPLHVLDHVINKLDLLLLMSVNPGFAAQQFIPTMLNKISLAKMYINTHNPDIILEVDGGINATNVKEVMRAGADAIVAGNAIFNNKNAVASASTSGGSIYDNAVRALRSA